MKNLNLFLMLIGAIFLNSCSNEVAETITYKINEPIFMNLDEFRASVRVLPQPTEIKEQGKIAFYQGFMYVSEPGKGIHIIDNRKPERPRNISFIELLGNVDMAIKGNTLYADSYIDMVWFDITSPADPKLQGRIENVFPETLPIPENQYLIDDLKDMDKSKEIVIGWKVTERTEQYVKNRDPWWNWGWSKDVISSPNSNFGNIGGGGIGLTGSMSRFAIYKTYLYTVKNNYLGIFDIERPAPKKAGDFYVGWDVETIFSYNDNMFMGTPTGMLIYSVTDPLKPAKMSSLQHVSGCDPVVVENDIAYVTIHSGNNCGQNNNQLIIIDVKDVINPKEIITYPMTNPKGLAIDNGILFVCDEGLKIYNAKNPQTLMENIIDHKKDMEGYDVIAFNNLLMMIAKDGIYQYDYSDLKNIRLLSKIPIGN